MRTFLWEQRFFDVSPAPSPFSSVAALFMIVALMCCLDCASVAAQDASPVLPPNAQEQLNSLASRLAEQIRNSKLEPAPPKVFVIDFFNASDKQFSKLGSFLADDFAESLGAVASGFQVEDRKSFYDYLKQNWMSLDALQNEAAFLTLARSMGAKGIIEGTIATDANQQLRIRLHTDGLGPAWTADALIPLTSQLQELLKQPATSFARSADAVAVEPGILQAGAEGVTLPICVFCPNPDYTDLARAAKYRGIVELSLIVTKDGQVSSVMVLRGAPFSLTQQAIETVQKWKFKPAKKNKQSVSVRVPVDIEFQLY
jgi:TonB family protein